MTSTRRKFIKSMLASSGALLSAPALHAGNPNRERILIIGAGMAGVSAGRRLHDAGHQVTILEARDRIGGRMWTSRRWEDNPVDLGASWIHGPRGNPLTDIANEIGALRRTTDSDVAPLYGPGGNLLPDRVWDELESYNNQIVRAIQRAGLREEDSSVEAAIERYVDRSGFTNTQSRRFQFTVNNYIEQEFADDVSNLSSHFIDEGLAFSGEDVILPNGYDALPRHLATGLDIRLYQQTMRIQYDERGVTVTTNTHRFVADRALVTLPIGVLKAQAVEFSPALPPAKLEAIDAIGVGVMNKFALRFPAVFWEEDADWIGYLSEEKGVFSNWLSFYRAAGIPVLLAFNVGTYGAFVESLSDSEALELAMATLRRMYGPNIPDPIGIQATRWRSDPFARCSYSSPVLGIGTRSREDLAAPVADRVFFAGEATSASYPSTVHGAYLTGQREAERILERAQRPKWRVSIERDSEERLRLRWDSRLSARLMRSIEVQGGGWAPVTEPAEQEGGCDIVTLERDPEALRQFFRLAPRNP